MHASVDHIWPRIQAHLADAVDESVFRVWLAPLEPVELEGDTLVLAAPARIAPWVAERFCGLLASCAAAAAERAVTVEVVAASPPASPRTPRRARVRGSAASRAAGRATGTAEQHRDDDTPPEVLANPKLTFEQFVIADCNRLAHAAALAVAEMPAQAFNPLFIFGRPGLGKTHLLHSIATYVQSYGGSLTVRHTTGEAFTSEFLLALRNGNTEAFKARFRHLDVLLVDDVQFLLRKTRTEEEFFHTFNVLTDMGSQVVLTSDRPPRDLDALEDRLRERFQSGLVAEITTPDVPTRVAILRKRIACDHIKVADQAVLEDIAAAAPDNIRALEGALIRAVAYASLSGSSLTPDLAREAIKGLYCKPQAVSPTLADITSATCEYFDVTPQALASPDRRARIAWPRHVAMYLSRELTSESLPAIGRHFGGRDHSTVLHAQRRAVQRITNDPAARTDVDNVSARLAASPS